MATVIERTRTGGGTEVARAGKPWRDRAYEGVMRILAPMERAVMQSSLVPTTPYLDPATFAWTQRLEANWTAIRDELDAVLVHRDDLPAFHEINADVSDIADSDWRTFFFYGFGFRAEANLRRCPRTATLLADIPGLTTAFFSILSPGVRLPPHRGPWRGVLRYHLGLMVPEPAEGCGLSVDGTVAHWREGGSLLFDDCYEHAAWNETTGTRVVLFLDVVRPCRLPGSLINRVVIKGAGLSPFVRDARRRYLAWERRYSAAHPD